MFLFIQERKRLPFAPFRTLLAATTKGELLVDHVAKDLEKVVAASPRQRGFSPSSSMMKCTVSTVEKQKASGCRRMA